MVETIAKQKMKQHEPVAASDQTYKQMIFWRNIQSLLIRNKLLAHDFMAMEHS